MTLNILNKVLIANRGEIAARIARTLHALGKTSVGLAARSDRAAYHSKSVDEFHWVDEEVPSQAFLNPETIIAAAKRTGADAVHPGYGFLSESPILAEACNRAGIVFIGPSKEALVLFGDKAATKERAHSLGLPVVSTTTLNMKDEEASQTIMHLQQEGAFPLLVKARAGGGGRGMRLVSRAELLTSECESASREAEKFFGDGTLLIEPYLEWIKHIEIQIVGDSTGKVAHLFERECSAQRSYQKILEEAPSCGISVELKERLYKDAITLCEGVPYQGLATVEFLVTPDEQHYFTEVNPRLQVEHPVTEEILGIDLVALQLHVAENRALDDFLPELSGLSPKGHAIQARINAESSYDFSPDVGTLIAVDVPRQKDLRIESVISARDEVTTDFDSLIMKLIRHGDTRAQVSRDLSEDLSNTNIIGVETNISFLRRVLEASEWSEATYTTTLTDALRRNQPSLREICTNHALGGFFSKLHPGEKLALAEVGVNAPLTSWDTFDSFRVAGREQHIICAQSKGEELKFLLSKVDESRWTVREVSDEDTPLMKIDCLDTGKDVVSLLIDGVPHQFRTVAIPSGNPAVSSFWVTDTYLGALLTITTPSLRETNEQRLHGSRIVSAPLPGKVLSVLVQQGKNVEADEQMVILESMKMEHAISSPRAAVVQEVLVKPGDTVTSGQKLVTLEG